MCALRDAAEQDKVRVVFTCVPDEESEDAERHSIEWLVKDRGLRGDFAITGEPTDLHIGIQAKGVLALRAAVHGTRGARLDAVARRQRDPEGPRRLPANRDLAVLRESSDLFDRPSINLARINGGDAFNKVPDRCEMDVDIRYLPNQDPGAILGQIRAIDDLEIVRCFTWPPAVVSRTNPYVLALRDSVQRLTAGESLSVGRDGASDAITFLDAGIPAVEFGPVGAGHHGPDEWVSIASLARYRRALTDFIDDAARAARDAERRDTRAEGGRGRPGVSPAPRPERGMLVRSVARGRAHRRPHGGRRAPPRRC